MADPLSITASVVAIVTAAVQSVKLLHSTVSRFKGRNKTLQRLQDELQDTTRILESLEQIVDAEKSVSALLEGPINRCSTVCKEFEHSMRAFDRKSKAGLLDWAKMEFMRGDINQFIDTISGYKSTLSVGLITINISTAKVSQQTLQEYNEMIQDTVHELNILLQRVDEKLESHTNASLPASSVNLDDEKEVTKLCLRICEDAKHFLETLKRKSTVLNVAEDTARDEEQKYFEAQVLTNQEFDKNQDSFADIITKLRKRLEVVVLRNGPGDDQERSRLLADINASKECLEVCKLASEASRRKVYRVGEVVADGDSDQVVVTTLADLFDVRRAVSKGNSAQLVGSMTGEEFRYVTEKRYNSRFGAVVQPFNSLPATTSLDVTKKGVAPSAQKTSTDQFGSRMNQRQPSSNEIRKRTTQDELQ